jgi:uncharacterized protein (TIGR04255 family)
MERPETPPKGTLNVPTADAAHYTKNFIRLATCELRFPTLLELEEHAPVAFSKAVRKEYPTYTRQTAVNVNPGGLAQAANHSFRSKNGRWTVTVRAAAISLETSDYDSFAEFEQRLGFVLHAAGSTIDTDFFTRVGLRYVNAVDFERATIRDWVNPSLVGALGEGVFGDVDEHWQRVRGLTDVGGYIFQHGLAIQPGSTKCEYVLDFDLYKEEVPVAETVPVVRKLHALEFSLFRWSLGEKALAKLGPSDLKGKS